PVNPNLLFVGNETGVFFTLDGGKKWVRLKGGLPTIAVRDIVVQARESDLVIATCGRGFYVLDNYALLRQVRPEGLQQEQAVFRVKDALLYSERHPIGEPGKGFQGDAFYAADNPPFGATVTYYLKEKLKTKKDLRHEAEKAADRKKEAMHYPNHDELRAEA